MIPAQRVDPEKIYVVELDSGQALLGLLSDAGDGWLKVRTGFRGHPSYVSEEEVVDITPAAYHPDVQQVK